VTIAVTGLSHHTSPIALRERLAFGEDKLGDALRGLKRRFPEGGAVILSTCNRVEIYTEAPEPPETLHKAIAEFLGEWHDIDQSAFQDTLYTLHERDAVLHLFKVASSLDSMVVGEAQILGQVQDAYLAAQSEDATDKVISAVFQRCRFSWTSATGR